jgi:chromosome segregation ATPase
MKLEDVLAAMEALEARSEKVSVRKVRDQMGGGSLGDVGEAIREVQKRRDRLNTIRSGLPQSLQDSASELAMNLWRAAQDLANQTVDDLRRGCEQRVATAERQASEALDDVDAAERRIGDLSGELDANRRECADLKTAKMSVEEREIAAAARLAALEAEIRVMSNHAKERERELEKAYRGIDRMTSALLGAQAGVATTKTTANVKKNGITKAGSAE